MQFHDGCAQARGQQPHEEVRGFHTRYYSANLMRGALVAAQPMQELEALVRAKFGAVPNADLAQPAFSGSRAGIECRLRILCFPSSIYSGAYSLHCPKPVLCSNFADLRCAGDTSVCKAASTKIK